MKNFEAMRDAVENFVNEMDEDNIISAWNSNDLGEVIYYLDEFDEVMYNLSPREIAVLAADCDWDDWSDYFTYDGEIQQSNCLDDLVDLDDLVEYIIDNDDDLGDCDLRKILDADYEEDEEDEDEEDE